MRPIIRQHTLGELVLSSGVGTLSNAVSEAVRDGELIRLGPGFLESIYEEALCVEFDRRKLAYQRQVPVRIRYKGVHVGFYRLDLVVDGKVVVEIKAVECIHESHIAVALAYLKATQLQVGLIINFSGSIMRSRRVFREND